MLTVTAVGCSTSFTGTTGQLRQHRPFISCLGLGRDPGAFLLAWRLEARRTCARCGRAFGGDGPAALFPHIENTYVQGELAQERADIPRVLDCCGDRLFLLLVGSA